MRFITEFELSADDSKHPERDYFIERKKEFRGEELFSMIEESFGWNNPVNGNKDHFRLEIEAFPMDKWVEFKKDILDSLPEGTIERHNIEYFIEKLESFGKPSGDAITNQQTNTNNG